MIPKIVSSLVIFIIFFLLLFLYTKWAGPISFSVNSITTTKNETFNVFGEGKVVTTPDVAVLTVGVIANGTSVKQAQDQVNLAINKVSEAIKKTGVSEADIQTTNYGINPNYDYSNGKQRIVGYQANANLSLKVKNIDNVNKVIDEATANGANQVGNVAFEVTDQLALQNQAREKAVADAKQKAEQAAKVAGFKLGRIVNYNEDFGNTPGPMPMMRTMGNVADEKVQTNIESGSSEVVVNVTLSYEIF